MNTTEIKKLIQDAIEYSSETSNIEFKDARGGFPKQTWKTISSFSHKPGGGIIVFGVVDNKAEKKMEIVGLDNIALLQETFSGVVGNDMSFTIRPDYHIFSLNSKNILAIYVSECPDQFKPCYYKPEGMSNGSYIRDGNVDRRMSEDEVRSLIENSRRLKFDITEAIGTTLEDLSKDKILDLLIKSGKRTQREVKASDINFELLNNLGIAESFNGTEKPTLGGFLIFAKNKPQDKQYFSRYVIRCVKYKGSNVTTDIIDSMDIDGTLDIQIDAIQKFILRNIKKGASIVNTKRVEKYEYPEQAVREIVANAIIHRDYKITETYTQINLFDDRLEIFNPGCLPPGVTVENIKDAQASRNEIIAARLKELDYLEEYGRGINIVFDKMNEWGLLPPIFKNSANSFKVILLGERLSTLNDRQIEVWNYLTEHKKVTAKECESFIKSATRKTINIDLKKMQEMGLIHQVGESVRTHYEANF